MFDNDGTPQFSSGLAISLLRCESDDDLERAIDPLVELVGSTNENCTQNVAPADLPAARIEFTVESSDGTHATAHAIRTDDCLGVLVLLWDRDRELLVQRELQMASQFRNVGQLYQALAHDLRSPVGTIVMAASLVRSIGDAALEPKSAMPPSSRNGSRPSRRPPPPSNNPSTSSSVNSPPTPKAPPTSPFPNWSMPSTNSSPPKPARPTSN